MFSFNLGNNQIQNCFFFFTDALLADLESSTAHISKCPVFLPDETPYSFPSSGSLLKDDTSPPPVPPPPSSEALNGSLQKQADSYHSSQQVGYTKRKHNCI